MAVAIRSSNFLATGNRANSVIVAPSSIVNGDVLLAFLSLGDPDTEPALAVTPPSGFVEVTGSPIVASEPTDPFTISLRCFYKIASGESGNYTFTHTTGISEGLMYSLSGADTSTPINPDPTVNEGTELNGTTTTALSITPTVDDSFIVMAEALWDDTIGMTPPAGTTPTFNARRAGATFYVSDGVLATAAATGDKSHTNGNSGVFAPWVCFLVCVQAAAAGGGQPTMRRWGGVEFMTPPSQGRTW